MDYRPQFGKLGARVLEKPRLLRLYALSEPFSAIPSLCSFPIPSATVITTELGKRLLVAYISTNELPDWVLIEAIFSSPIRYSPCFQFYLAKCLQS